ncbi:hypothetical protein glysoja_035760 [Glycine soja]|uniref:Aspergillus nuclease S1 n=1 Tax=Glycine soja TaxID=3848 RepID=A0A0B2P859_GLYSO|nr:hypothetical protein glysoja_035760 [Glycine soja]
MEYYKIQLVAIVSLMLVLPNTQGWGEDGHAIIISSFYELEHSRLSDSAVDAVKNLLPEYAQNDLGNVCSWADRVRFYLHWSGPLHFADTPGNL